jgi:hypothetical protein
MFEKGAEKLDLRGNKNRMKTAFIMCTFQRHHYYDEVKEAMSGERGRTCMMHLEGEKCRYIKF